MTNLELANTLNGGFKKNKVTGIYFEGHATLVNFEKPLSTEDKKHCLTSLVQYDVKTEYQRLIIF